MPKSKSDRIHTFTTTTASLPIFRIHLPNLNRVPHPLLLRQLPIRTQTLIQLLPRSPPQRQQRRPQREQALLRTRQTHAVVQAVRHRADDVGGVLQTARVAVLGEELPGRLREHCETLGILFALMVVGGWGEDRGADDGDCVAQG